MAVVTTHTKAIDGVTYTTKLFPASKGLELMRQIASLVSDEALTLVLGVDPAKLDGLAKNAALLATIFRGAAERAAPGEFSSMVTSILSETTSEQLRLGEAHGAGSVATHFDDHFAGRYEHMFEVVTWVLRVGFGEP